MSYYLYRISQTMENLNDKGLKMYNSDYCKQIRKDMMKMKSTHLCMVQFKNDVKRELGLDVPKDHHQSYYISDFADKFNIRYLRYFIVELKAFLPLVESPDLQNIINSLIESYGDEEWVLNR